MTSAVKILPRLIWWLTGLCFGLTFVGCETTRYLNKNEKLIQKDAQFIGNESLGSDKLRSGVMSKPNRRILIPKIYLHFYNLGLTIEKDSSGIRKWIEKIDKRGFLFKEIPDWLKKDPIGESAKVVNEAQLVEDCKNLENIYFSNGFFNARVQYEVIPNYFNPRKAVIRFHVKENTAHYLNRVVYQTKDTNLVLILTRELSKSKVRNGERYNDDLLTEERNRITEILREKGYYKFLPSQVSYIVDTVIAPEDLKAQFIRTLQDKKPRKYLNVTIVLPDTAYVYTINNVTVRLRTFADDSLSIKVNPDSLNDEQLRYLGLPKRRYDPEQKIQFQTTENAIHMLNFRTLNSAIQFRPNQRFSVNASQISQRRLQEMGIFNNAIIRYYPNDRNKTLIAETDLILQKRIGFKVGLEAFQADQFNLGSNYPGVGSNLEISIRNAFRRAELITSTANGSVYFLNQQTGTDSLAKLRFFLQWGGRVALRVPRFWFLQPLADKIQAKKRATFINPITSLSLLYRRDNPLIYIRSTFQTEYTYQWFHEEFGKRRKLSQFSSFSPFNITLVRSEYNQDLLVQTITRKKSLSDLNSSELRLIDFLLQDLTRRFVSYSSYYRTISYNYGQDRRRNTWFMRVGSEMGGNLPFLIDAISKNVKEGDGETDDAQVLLGSTTYSYGQFFKLSWEGKYFIPINKQIELVSRMYLGYATRIGDTKQMLFENRFYSGGTNSVRGWQSNSLGPGSVPFNSNTGFFIGGEYKFEANIEYRQDLVGPTELALFLDAGNVWFSKTSKFEDVRGKLGWNNLDIGLAGGIGLRFDLTFVILRFDIGQQLYAPDLRGWVVKDWKDIGFPRIQYNLAIGYPF